MSENKHGGADFHNSAEIEGDVIAGDKVHIERFILEIGDDKIPFDQKVELVKKYIKDINTRCEHYQLINDVARLREWSSLHDQYEQGLKSLYQQRLQEIEQVTKQHEPLNKVDAALRRLGWRRRRP